MAENALVADTAGMQSEGATDASMIYLDSKNGDVLAYV
jgi:cell division protein FtsI/penicillin-binding protein 2